MFARSHEELVLLGLQKLMMEMYYEPRMKFTELTIWSLHARHAKSCIWVQVYNIDKTTWICRKCHRRFMRQWVYSGSCTTLYSGENTHFVVTQMLYKSWVNLLKISAQVGFPMAINRRFISAKTAISLTLKYIIKNVNIYFRRLKLTYCLIIL